MGSRAAIRYRSTEPLQAPPSAAGPAVAGARLDASLDQRGSATDSLIDPALQPSTAAAKCDGPDSGTDQSGNVVELEGVSVRFGQGSRGTTALDETTLDIRKGEFISFVGPSGCGKSTILRLISGLVRPSNGVVVVGGREVGAKALRIGMAFQNASMMPWLTVERNVMLPLKIVQPYRADYRRMRKGEYRDKVRALLAQVGLKDFADHFPWQLSGGMLQRANLCRALIHEPSLLLLDEPFGALDQFTREELWGTLQALWLDKRPTVLLVTHDLREASYLSSRICVMSPRPGRIIDDSEVKFAYPRTLNTTYEPDFVALGKRLRDLIVPARIDGAP
jgi:NitT/TauT family transport system ATP-binding protein